MKQKLIEIANRIWQWMKSLWLCYKSLFINSPVEDWSEFNEQDIKMYYNLGNDLLENYSDKDIAILTKNKYVVIFLPYHHKNALSAFIFFKKEENYTSFV